MRSPAVAILLLVLLVASNTWWVYRALDAGVSLTYRDASLEHHRRALGQALAVLPVAARPDATRQEVLDAAAAAAPGSESFEKEGTVWVGRLGLAFGSDGRLREAVPAWEPFETRR